MEKRAQLVGHRASIGLVAFSPDSSMLATPMGDGTILLWNVQSGQIVKILGSHRGLVRSVAFSPDGKLIASAGSDGTVRLWDLAKSQMTAVLGVHARPAYSVAFSPDGKLVASASLDHTAKLWDVEEARELTTFKGHSVRVWSVSFSRLETGNSLSLAAWMGPPKCGQCHPEVTPPFSTATTVILPRWISHGTDDGCSGTLGTRSPCGMQQHESRSHQFQLTVPPSLPTARCW